MRKFWSLGCRVVCAFDDVDGPGVLRLLDESSFSRNSVRATRILKYLHYSANFLYMTLLILTLNYG
jgi:hypothetical protein